MQQKQPVNGIKCFFMSMLMARLPPKHLLSNMMIASDVTTIQLEIFLSLINLLQFEDMILVAKVAGLEAITLVIILN